jgi:hypothetical protein
MAIKAVRGYPLSYAANIAVDPRLPEARQQDGDVPKTAPVVALTWTVLHDLALQSKDWGYAKDAHASRRNCRSELAKGGQKDGQQRL